MTGIVGLGRVRRLSWSVGLMFAVWWWAWWLAWRARWRRRRRSRRSRAPRSRPEPPGLGGVQPGRGAARDRQRRRQHGVGVLGELIDGGVDAGRGLPVRDRQRPVLGGVQPGRGAARNRQLRPPARCRCSRSNSDGGLTRSRAPRSRPAATRSRWRSARAGGCSQPPTSAPTRCRCSR